MFLDFLKDIGNYETRKVERTICKNGIIVSTAYSSDEGYETALIDKKGAHPIERYENKEHAIEEHKKWVKFSENGIGKKIEELISSDLTLILKKKEVILE